MLIRRSIRCCGRRSASLRLPLIALSVIRVLVIVLIVFLPIRTVLGIHSLWLLPLLAAAVLVAGHFGWFASAYLSVETRFLTNFNERLLQKYGDSDDATWVDEKLYVTELDLPIGGGREGSAGSGLGQALWREYHQDRPRQAGAGHPLR